MQLKRAVPVLGVAAVALAIACSDSSSTAPDAARTNVAATGQTDTGKTNPGNPTNPPAPTPDSGKPTNPTPPTTPSTPTPDTGARVNPSTDPRQIGGTVVGMGPAGDTANYQKLAGATVVLSLPADTTAGVAEKEIARATTAADGSFALGTFKLGAYSLTVTPATGSPFKSTHWTFLIDQYSSAKVNLLVWLGRQ